MIWTNLSWNITKTLETKTRQRRTTIELPLTQQFTNLHLQGVVTFFILHQVMGKKFELSSSNEKVKPSASEAWRLLIYIKPYKINQFNLNSFFQFLYLFFYIPIYSARSLQLLWAGTRLSSTCISISCSCVRSNVSPTPRARSCSLAWIVIDNWNKSFKEFITVVKRKDFQDW